MRHLRFSVLAVVLAVPVVVFLTFGFLTLPDDSATAATTSHPHALHSWSSDSTFNAAVHVHVAGSVEDHNTWMTEQRNDNEIDLLYVGVDPTTGHVVTVYVP